MNFKIYDIIDNGDVVFKCIDLFEENKIEVYKVVYDKKGNFKDNKYILSRKYDKLFIGNDPLKISDFWNESFLGNSILVKIAKKKNAYTFIGYQIFDFETDEDEIIDFHSYIKEGIVSYPYAIGKEYSYIFFRIYKDGKEKLYKNSKVKIPNEFLDLNEDIYFKQYYDVKGQAFINSLPFEIKIRQNRNI